MPDLLIGSGLGGGVSRILLPHPPDARGDVEPDVAVIELGDGALLRRDREPFDEEEIGEISIDAPTSIMVAGFPSEYARTELWEQLRPGAQIITLTPTYVRSRTLIGRRAAKEPHEGRGIHLHFGGEASTTGGGTTTFPEPHGLSGGPVVTLEGGRLRLAVPTCARRPSAENGRTE